LPNVRREHNVDAHNLASLARLVGNRTWGGAALNASISSTYAVSSATKCVRYHDSES
jgi:hypothetical protein